MTVLQQMPVSSHPCEHMPHDDQGFDRLVLLTQLGKASVCLSEDNSQQLLKLGSLALCETKSVVETFGHFVNATQKNSFQSCFAKNTQNFVQFKYFKIFQSCLKLTATVEGLPNCLFELPPATTQSQRKQQIPPRT